MIASTIFVPLTKSRRGYRAKSCLEPKEAPGSARETKLRMHPENPNPVLLSIERGRDKIAAFIARAGIGINPARFTRRGFKPGMAREFTR